MHQHEFLLGFPLAMRFPSQQTHDESGRWWQVFVLKFLDLVDDFHQDVNLVLVVVQLVLVRTNPPLLVLLS
jgi:hypothetical protein